MAKGPVAPLRVAIAVPHGVPFFERFLLGMAEHARAADWTFMRMPERMDTSLDWLRGWDGDAALVTAQSPADVTVARSLTMPVVNLAGHQPNDGLPYVGLDHVAVGRLAARHLRERSFTNLAFYGVAGRRYSDLRRAGFVTELGLDGLTPAVLEADAASPQAWMDHQGRLEAWIRGLPAPVGLFACTDERAVEVLEVCRRLGRRVPQDVAVLGVDDDPVLCEFAQPSLSSIARNDQAAGRAAAALLQRLVEARRRGRPAPATTPEILIPPANVVERRSTAAYAVEHPQVAALVRRIEERLHEPVGIDELIEGLPLARRRLEELFRAELGCAPYQMLLRLRLRAARELMARKDGSTLTAIALASGFRSLRHLRAALRRSEPSTGP